MARHPDRRMLIQFASDLHLEFVERRWPQQRLLLPAPGAQLLVLAGDIHNGCRGVEAFADWPVPVVYVAGNHEFYDQSWQDTRARLREACDGTRVTVLDNDVLDIGDLRILGCTLWTDFRLYTDARHPGPAQAQAVSMDIVERGLTDYRLIRSSSGLLRARETLADHEASRQWLTRQLARPWPGSTLVVTHHGPHPLSIAPRFAGHPINPGFISDLSPLMPHVDLWLHGHTHDSFDYRVGRCRVLANPAGYVLNRASPGAGVSLELENAAFDPMRVIEVAAGPAA